MDKEKFHDYLQVNFLKAFNLDSLSSVSNAELSNLAKTAASVATIWFLMTDNYNMVMLKSMVMINKVLIQNSKKDLYKRAQDYSIKLY